MTDWVSAGTLRNSFRAEIVLPFSVGETEAQRGWGTEFWADPSARLPFREVLWLPHKAGFAGPEVRTGSQRAVRSGGPSVWGAEPRSTLLRTTLLPSAFWPQGQQLGTGSRRWPDPRVAMEGFKPPSPLQSAPSVQCASDPSCRPAEPPHSPLSPPLPDSDTRSGSPPPTLGFPSAVGTVAVNLVPGVGEPTRYCAQMGT